MAEKQLIIAIEGTAAMGPYWNTVVAEYLEKIIRCFCGNDMSGQKLSAASTELSLVVFTVHGSYCGCLVQRSGWTRDADVFLHWLSAVPFSGGGFIDAAVGEGLSEALMMFALPPNSSQSVEMNKHCILVSASNPYSLPTPVYRTQIPNLDQSENKEVAPESCLADAETVAKSFAQCSVSLSVISPRQLPKLRGIYNAGKRNPRAAEPAIDVKNPYFLVLLSEHFMEARAALSRSGITNMPANQSPLKMDTSSVPSVSGPLPTSIPPVNGAMMSRQSIPVGSTVPATVKVEPNTIPSSAFPHPPSVSHGPSQGITTLQSSPPSSTSQEMITNNDNVQEFKPLVGGLSQPLRPTGPAAANVNILNNLSQVRQAMNSANLNAANSMGLQTIGATPMAMHMTNMISSGMASTALPPAQNVFSPGQSGSNTAVSGSGSLVGTTQIPQNTTLGGFSSATSSVSVNPNHGMSQPMANLQGPVSLGQSAAGINQGNLTGGQIGQAGIGMNQNIMNNGLGQPGVSAGGGTMIPTPGVPQQVQAGIQPLGVANTSTANMPAQQTSGAMQSQPGPDKYVKVWEGALSGQRQGQPVFITKLEGYRSASVSETLAADWPMMMQIVRLISQDHMHNKQYVGKADFLVFRALNQHGFLGQLQEKKLCAVIQLPSQTLLLSVSDKASRLIGMLFPG
ncbi:hypothetical protein MKX01_008749, partial [Papaver californicum]